MKGFFMYTNKIGCTVYEKTVKNRMESYVPHFLPTVYWRILWHRYRPARP